MLNRNEITTLSLSPTNKDFVQIWNELLEVAGKLSERWDPTSTNESDPGIVLLKALTGIADKLNYNIDKNILEAFMPTAAQEDSMRKLCDMLGYNIKYYRSAKTNVTIKHHSNELSEEEDAELQKGLPIPKFTILTNSDQDINYFTINQTPVFISADTPIQTIECMEGQIVKCESINDNSVILPSQISELNRFYLPETQIAENGIFVYNVFYDSVTDDIVEGDIWGRVENLNIQPRGSRVFKFGFDSYAGRPYLEFPADYSTLFRDGIFIYYARTSGANGNISANTLTNIELPTVKVLGCGDWEKVSAENFSVDNAFAATSGSNIETIEQAYTNFKKTIGTFDTLVTCRDYMNKVYSMLDPYYGTPYVSNILVTDIRNDLNRAITICSCDDAGIYYKEKPLKKLVNKKVTIPAVLENKSILLNKPEFKASDKTWRLGGTDGMVLSGTALVGAGTDFNDRKKADSNGVYLDTNSQCWAIKQNGVEYITTLKAVSAVPVTVSEYEPLIDHFDLVLYPYKNYKQVKAYYKDIATNYNESFKYTTDTLTDITAGLTDDKLSTIAHNFISPEPGDVVSINNYLRLNATIATNSKVSEDEGKTIIANIKMALANAFNMRELNFGEEIPFDAIVDVIEKSDSRIRIASLNEPAVYTTFSVLNDNPDNPIIEYAVASNWLTEEDATSISALKHKDSITGEVISFYNTNEAKEYYNKLTLRNILAGRVPLFKYNNKFSTNFAEAIYQDTESFLLEAKLNVNKDGTSKISPDSVNFSKPETESGVVSEQVKEEVTNLVTALANEGVLSASSPNYIKSTVSDETADTETIYVQIITPLAEELMSGDPIAEPVSDVDIEIRVKKSKTRIKNSLISGVSTNSDSPEIDTNPDPSKQNPITAVSTLCEMPAQQVEGADCYEVSDLELSNSEFLKFRAPRLITTATYPAYVNYRLDLDPKNTAGAQAATPAKANNLFDILNADIQNWSTGTNRWQRLMAFFEAKSPSPVKTLRIAFNVPGVNSEEPPTINTEDITLGAVNLNTIFKESGCIFLLNKDRKIKSTNSEALPTHVVSKIPELSTPLITNNAVVSLLKNEVETIITRCFSGLDENEFPKTSWQLYYDFKYVPFNAETMSLWLDLINPNDEAALELDFIPKYKDAWANDEKVFWRTFGEGYEAGRCILENSKKLVKFTKNHFGLLSGDNNLSGIYVLEDFGTDAVAASIGNNVEYALRGEDTLYIHYTPSSTTEDGKTKTEEPKYEVYKAPTIIKPSGFASGLIDSATYTKQGHSPAKRKVPFEGEGEHDLFSLGASEQIEIRELAKVDLSSKTFKNHAGVWVYKNFNNETLEKPGKLEIPRKYILGEGEYIFYTDQKKAEFAYYTNGTEVTLTGDVCIPKFEIIKIEDILDSNIDAIPWKYVSLAGITDNITFQEYQYVTLGAGDKVDSVRFNIDNSTLKKLEDAGKPASISSERWNSCESACYLLADKSSGELPQISLGEAVSGCGWDVSSIFEFSASPSEAQTLRYVPDKIETALKVHSADTGGAGGVEKIISPKQKLDTAQVSSEMQVKTNIPCQANGTKRELDKELKVQDVTGLELKIFTEKKPCIIQTRPDTVVPAKNTIDFSTWTGEPIAAKSPIETWSTAPLESLRRVMETKTINDVEVTRPLYDNALKLSINTLPDTYGIVTFYVDFKKTATNYNESQSVWLDFLPGTEASSIMLLNATEEERAKAIVTEGLSAPRLILRQGINCVLFDKTCEFFVKASDNASGSLFFDDPKLVSCLPIEFSESVGLKHTYGLNLAQLGYFKTRAVGHSNVLGSTALGQFILGSTTIGDWLELTTPGTEGVNSGSTTAPTEEEVEPELLELIAREKQLLADIMAVDIERDFYYTAIPENSLALEFGSKASEATMLNPDINYDVNNINNSFVISKLDIDYLDTGLQIARSSKLSR